MQELLTPDTQLLSPSELEAKVPLINRNDYLSSHHSFEPGHGDQQERASFSSEQSHLPGSLPFSKRSRGVQTIENWKRNDTTSLSGLARPFSDTMSTSSPHDGHSESSSLMDGQSTVLSALIDRVGQLLARLTQADALTLTNRLKRQRLLGADVSHLSRSTVSSILQEATALRSNFRAFLEDDKLTTTCTRRDLRTLLKLVRDIFNEMGQMRVTLNDVILDPSVAVKVSDLALNPTKPESVEHGAVDAGGTSSGAPSWMGPISKLLRLPGGSSLSPSDAAAARALSPPGVRPRPGAPGSRVPSRVAPKREAALAASAMTVNVEFSGAAIGRAVTSTYSAHPEREDSISILAKQSTMARTVSASAEGSSQSQQDFSKSVMGIFAGAPAPRPEGSEPWVVIPRAPRSAGAGPSRVNTLPLTGPENTATLGRSTAKRLSRVVDAMIDSNAAASGTHRQGGQDDGDRVAQSTLLERTLSRRGLSDSSIHTTFLQHGGDGGNDEGDEDDSRHVKSTVESGGEEAQDRASVLQALSRTMSNFRFGSAHPHAPPLSSNSHSTGGISGDISRPETPVSRAPPSSSTAVSPSTFSSPSHHRVSAPRPIAASNSFNRSGGGGGGGIFSFSAWAATLDADTDSEEGIAARAGNEGFFANNTVAAPRDETYLHRTWEREHDF